MDKDDESTVERRASETQLDWIERRVSDLYNDAVKIGAHCVRHFLAVGSKPAARKRAAANSRATSRDGAERCNWSAIRHRRRHRRRTLDQSTRQNLFGPMAARGQAGRT